MKTSPPKKIAFCITCMNRLKHIRETLIRNITDNFLPDEVEFVLLDYNSTDGLEDWVMTLNEYINSGILIYYRTKEPEIYNRSHSRNMAFRLSDAEIYCNLDADNFLGRGFAMDMVNQFKNDKDIFYTSDYRSLDMFGRICLRTEDYIKVRGYNEILSGWGSEDVEFISRLKDTGLRQFQFMNDEYYNAISHSNEDRISQEKISKLLKSLYISHITPYKSEVLMINNDFTYEFGVLINNKYRYFNITDEQFKSDNWLTKEGGMNYIVIEGDIKTGRWTEINDEIEVEYGRETQIFRKNGTKITDGQNVFYQVTNSSLRSFIIMSFSNAVNTRKIQQNKRDGASVNPKGFGKGVVYRNFDYNNTITLV